MNILLYKLIRFFELKFGWFFINGRKQSAWKNYLTKKYKLKNHEKRKIN